MSGTPDVAARWKRRAVELASVPVSLSVETIDDLAAAIGLNLRQSNIFIEIKDVDLVAKTVFAEAVEVALNAANSIDVIPTGGGDPNRGFVSSVDTNSFTVTDGSGTIHQISGPAILTYAEAQAITNARQTTVGYHQWNGYHPFRYDPSINASFILYLAPPSNNTWISVATALDLHVNGNIVQWNHFGSSGIWLDALYPNGVFTGFEFIGFITSSLVTPAIGTEMLDLGLAGWIQKPPANLSVIPVAPPYDPVVSQPLNATRYSIAFAPSIGGVVTPTWQVWDLSTGFALANQATMATNTGVRAPTMAEAVSTVYYGRWYNNAYTDLGRKS